ncbi:MAG: S53 family peptidase [Solirubrobacteraceae bacterium]
MGAISLSVCAAGAAVAAPLHVTFNAHFTQPPTTAQCEQQIGIACYGPTQYELAYDMNPLYQAGLTGAGKTIVIVDSFGSPTIESDLQTFDQAYGLPAPPSFQIIQPDGPVPPFDPTNPADPNWGIETSLDVEYSHAMAPGANILLVETPVAETEGTVGFPQIVEAENYVIDHHLGDVISQSFGATEQTFPSAQSIKRLRSAYVNAWLHRITVVSGAGDGGPTDQTDAPDAIDYYPFRVDSWPSTDPLVTSVGGTQLHLDADGNRLAPDNVWNDTALLAQLNDAPPSPAAGGGGLSVVFPRPWYQDGVASTVGLQRGTPDVSMTAAVDGGANVYWSFDASALGFPSTPVWAVIGGTSEATPMFAGVVAVADQAAGHDLGLLNPRLYGIGDGVNSGLTDVTAGDTDQSFVNPATDPFPGPQTVAGYAAVAGYDLATGLGTPDGVGFVNEFAGGSALTRR